MDENVVIPGEAEKLRVRIRRRRTSADAYWPAAREDCTGCSLWWGAAVLAREALRAPEVFRGRRVIELGAGCGLLGIVMARLARSTLLTDASEAVLENCEHNLRVNEHIWRSEGYEPHREVRTQLLRWEDVVSSGPWPMEERAEIVLSSDTLYGEWGETLAQAMLNVVVPGGLALLCFAADCAIDFDSFRSRMEDAGYRMVLSRRRWSIGPYCEQAGADFILCECRREVFGRPGLHILERGDVMVYALQSKRRTQAPHDRWLRQKGLKKPPGMGAPACLWWPQASRLAVAPSVDNTESASSASSLESEPE